MESQSREEFRKNISKFSIPELLEIMDTVSSNAANTVEMLSEEIQLRLMEQAE
jgi:hypothetical protein